MHTRLLHSLEGARIRLREISIHDAEDMHAYLADEEVSRYIGWKLMNTVEDTRAHIEALLKREAAGTHWYAAVILKSTGALIGNAMMFNVSSTGRHAEIGYVFHKGCWGQGYGTECVALLNHFAFDELRLRKLYACAAAANTASTRVLEKTGYQLEETLTDGSLRFSKRKGK